MRVHPCECTGSPVELYVHSYERKGSLVGLEFSAELKKMRKPKFLGPKTGFREKSRKHSGVLRVARGGLPLAAPPKRQHGPACVLARAGFNPLEFWSFVAYLCRVVSLCQ